MDDSNSVDVPPASESAGAAKFPGWLTGAPKGEQGQTRSEPIAESKREPLYRRWYLYAVLIPVAFALGIGSGYWLWGRQAVQSAQSEAQPGAVKRYDVPEDNDPAIGPKNAAITIIEFSDYECPFCRRWYNDVFLKLREEYPDKVRVVYRDFPLFSLHPDAEPAAEAANCANEQGAYWEYHNKLFSSTELGQSTYLRYASELGLDADKFKACLDSRRYANEIKADYDYASNLGVQSTPTFFLNGIPIVGAQPYEVFKQVIEKELAGEIPK
jgi:protein-disulfide isomerase